MSNNEIVSAAIGMVVLILGYFLKSLIEEHKFTQKLTIENKAKIDLVENNQDNLRDRFHELFEAVKDLTKEIRNLTVQISKKKDI